MEFFYFEGAVYVTFLSLNKKVTKEVSQRGAEAGSSRTRAAPFGIPRRASPVPLEHLNGQDLVAGCGLSDSGGSALAALPIISLSRPSGKKSGHFLPEQDRG